MESMGNAIFMLSCFSNPFSTHISVQVSLFSLQAILQGCCIVTVTSSRHHGEVCSELNVLCHTPVLQALMPINMSVLTMVDVVLQMGLSVAAEYVLEIGIEAIWERVQHIASMLRQQLQQLKGVTVQDRGRLLCGIVSFTMVRLLCFMVCCKLQASLITVFMSVLVHLS